MEEATENARRRLARASIASLQAAAQQAARRGSQPEFKSTTSVPIQLNLPFTHSELQQARQAANNGHPGLLRSKTSSNNLLAHVKGYFKQMQARDLGEEHMVVDGITVVT